MENQLQIFNNAEFGDVRVIMKGSEPWFVAADVARELELQNIRQNLASLDEDEKGVSEIYTPGGYQNMSIVNESGLYALIFMSRKPEAKRFRKWVTNEVLPTIRKTGNYSIQNARPTLKGDEIHIVGTMAEDIQSLFGVNRGIAISQALDVVGTNLKLNFNSLKQLLPPAEHETGYLNPTQIGEKLGGLPARVVNKMLADAGLQYRDGKNWRLTEAGKAYGEEMPYTRNGHSGYQILWNESVVDYLSGKAA